MLGVAIYAVLVWRLHIFSLSSACAHISLAMTRLAAGKDQLAGGGVQSRKTSKPTFYGNPELVSQHAVT